MIQLAALLPALKALFAGGAGAGAAGAGGMVSKLLSGANIMGAGSGAASAAAPVVGGTGAAAEAAAGGGGLGGMLKGLTGKMFAPGGASGGGMSGMMKNLGQKMFMPSGANPAAGGTSSVSPSSEEGVKQGLGTIEYGGGKTYTPFEIKTRPQNFAEMFRKRMGG